MSVFDKLPEMEGRLICNGQICIGQRIGYGGWGAVYKGETVGTINAPVAVKCIPRKGLGDFQRSLLDNEVHYHHKVSGMHKSILEHLGTFVDEKHDILFVITEYCPHGDMFEAIFDASAFRGKDQAIKRRFIEILDAVQAMHNAGVFHRDLKPENIFVRLDGTPVVGDFGFATNEEYTDNIGMGSAQYMTPGK